MRTQRLGAAAGAEPWGDAPDDEIAITRANETETFETEQLVAEPDTIAIHERDDGEGWEADADDDEFAAEPDAAAEPPGFAGEVSVVEEKGLGVTPQGKTRTRGGVTESEEIDYKLPPTKALERGKADPGPDMRDREATAKALLESLRHFGVEARLLGTVSGPHVSRYELQLAPGTKVAKVAQLKDDLAYALASTDIRILAPIPGKKAVGVEVPNQRRRLVRLGDIYDRAGRRAPRRCSRGSARTSPGQSVNADLALMPHVLVAGTTGSGKSGCINAILTLDPDARVAERGAAGARRPEAGRAQPLRARAAPAHPGGHQPADGRQRARQPDRGDGEPLRA